MKPITVTIVSVAVACMLPASVLGHGYMNIPTGRTTDTINDMDNTGVCDSDEPGTVTEFESGETIQVQWSRNNHIGGFIRFSLAPKDDATKETFDSSAFYYVCREVNCGLKECGDDKYCGDDSGAADNEIKCGTNITLPNYLEAGDYVLQWTWFAAGSSYGHVGWTTGNFRTCADIKLTTSGSGTSKPSCPTFVGGDRATAIDNKPSNQCFYFDTNDLVTKEVQYDDDYGYTRYMYGVPAEVERCSGSTSNSTASTSSSESSASSTPALSSSNGEASSTTSAAEDWDSEGSNGESSTSSSAEDWDSENSGDWSNNDDTSGGDDTSNDGESSSPSSWSSDNDEDSNGDGSEIGNEADGGSTTGSGLPTEADTTPEATPIKPTGGCRAKSSRHV